MKFCDNARAKNIDGGLWRLPRLKRLFLDYSNMIKKSIGVYNATKEIELTYPTLSDVLFYAKKLCDENGVGYDENKIGVGVDCGTMVIVYLIEGDNE